MNDSVASVIHHTPETPEHTRARLKKEQAAARMRRKRALAGDTTAITVEMPRAVAGAVSRLVTGSRRGFRGGYARALLKGAMMEACAGQSQMAAVLGTEFQLIKDYLASLDEEG